MNGAKGEKRPSLKPSGPPPKGFELVTDLKLTSDYLDLLQEIDLFEHLEEEDHKALKDNADCIRATKADAAYVKEGEEDATLYIILRGNAHVYKKRSTGQSTYIAELKPGDISGFGSMIDNDVHRATAVSKDKNLVLARVNKQQMKQMLISHPNIGMGMLRFMTRRLKLERFELARYNSGNILDKKTICFFDSQPYWKKYFEECKTLYPEKYGSFDFKYVDVKLNEDTALMATGATAVCIFVNDCCNANVCEVLSNLGVDQICLRCAGFNNVDIEAAGSAFNMGVTRVPAYSPYAVAEFALTLLMSINRRIVVATNRTRTGNFSLHGLVGFDLYGKTVGVVGTGKIGQCFANIMLGMGCNLLCHDLYQNAELKANPKVKYVDMDELLANSDVISLHAPLLDSTKHCINDKSIAKMKKGVYLVNTSRGGLVDTRALIRGLKSGHIGGAGLDVYEEEGDYFFSDVSDNPIEDDVLARLLAFNNVIVSSHQAFFTEDALRNIAKSTCESLWENFEGMGPLQQTNTCLPKPSS
eukprot:Nk52_evm4s680 gene=Nk52_evmTU4s680